MSVMAKVCRHCEKAVVSRPRGLCWRCFHRPEVLGLYPSLVRRGSGINARGLVAPKCPTNALPGTQEKLDVMKERARRGERLWHPDDATVED